MNIPEEDLKRFLDYLQDKVEKCYKEETKFAIETFFRVMKGSNMKEN